MNYNEESLKQHKAKRGKLEITSTFPLETREDLSIAYTPGVAEPCKEIAKDKSLAYEYTMKGRSVAVVTDGSAVLGLGNIGSLAGLPVMEGKAILFKRFANIDAYPICLATQNIDEIVATVKNIAPGFGGINLEDISAPNCFEVERRLIEELDIPVMHDDQHGTAVVVLAGLLNALNVAEKKIEDVHVVLSGAGAAGMGIVSLLIEVGVKHIDMIDSKGIITEGREGMNEYKNRLARQINPEKKIGTLADALLGADVFIGVSQPNVLTQDMIKSMADKPIVFAMANPIPEIMPEVAQEAGVYIFASGRSDYPNQANNVLAFPGLFKGALDGRIRKFTSKMYIAASYAIAGMVPEPSREKIFPTPFEPGIADAIARAVQESA